MKKTGFLLAFWISASLGFAQIEMNSAGKVSIGSVSPSSSYYELTTINAKFNGQRVSFQDTYNGITYGLTITTSYNGYYYYKALKAENNKSQIGSSGRAFNRMYAYNYTTVSDKRQKEKIRKLNNPLQLIQALKGVMYDFKKSVYLKGIDKPSAGLIEFAEKDRKNKIGFIAQDVKKVLPEIVNYDDSTDTYTMDYSKIIPVLVEAIKEQQAMIDKLTKQVRSNNSKSSNARSATVEDEDSAHLSDVVLYQNEPNPFDKSTIIRYSLPKKVKEATIFLYDLNGVQKSSYTLEILENGKLELSSKSLDAGMYLYSLVADGVLVSTKRMILTD